MHIFSLSWRRLNPKSASAVETTYNLDRSRLVKPLHVELTCVDSLVGKPCVGYR